MLLSTNKEFDFKIFEKNIESLKKKVLKMLREREADHCSDKKSPSSLWSDALILFKYIFNLSAEDFIMIREHTGKVTGDWPLSYWGTYPPINPEVFAEELGYSFYTKDLPEKYHLSEPEFLNGFHPVGVYYKGKLINKNISRYQCCVSNLYLMGALDAIEKNIENRIILEIGAGYGGMANCFSSFLENNLSYIVLDLPEMLMLSGAFLYLNNPDSKIYVYEKSTFTDEFLRSEIYDYDIVLLPNFIQESLLKLKSIDIIINTQSFQEMTSEQIKQYLALAKKKLSGFLYSDNIDCMPLNKEMNGNETVTGLLKKSFFLFPSPEIYEKRIYQSKGHWFYKCYVARCKEFERSKEMRIQRWENRYYLSEVEGELKIREEPVKRTLTRPI